MDKRKIIDDNTLRRVVQSRPQPHEPAFMTEKIMREVRREHERQLRRERRLFLIPIAVATLILLVVGCCAIVYVANAEFELTPIQQLVAILLPCFYLLYELQRWLCKKWEIPE